MAKEAKKAVRRGGRKRVSAIEAPEAIVRIAQVIERKRAAARDQGTAASAPLPSDVSMSATSAMRSRGDADAALERAVKRLAQLRAWRERKGRDVTLTETISVSARSLKKARSALGGFIDAWREVIPPAQEACTRIKSLRGGVATIEVQSGPVMYEVTRLLRSGAEAELRRRFKGTLARVVVRVANGWET